MDGCGAGGSVRRGGERSRVVPPRGAGGVGGVGRVAGGRAELCRGPRRSQRLGRRQADYAATVSAILPPVNEETAPDAPRTGGNMGVWSRARRCCAGAASRSRGFPSDAWRIIWWTLCERSGMARRARDGKAQELAASRTLNPRPEAAVDEGFQGSEFFDARDLAQVKYEMVRRVEADRVSVSAAVGAFGFSRQSYYPAARALADEGLAGLDRKS